MNEDGVTLNKLISTFLLPFLDKELNFSKENGRKNTGIGFQT